MIDPSIYLPAKPIRGQIAVTDCPRMYDGTRWLRIVSTNPFQAIAEPEEERETIVPPPSFEVGSPRKLKVRDEY